jgi:hypothetical protein
MAFAASTMRYISLTHQGHLLSLSLSLFSVTTGGVYPHYIYGKDKAQLPFSSLFFSSLCFQVPVGAGGGLGGNYSYKRCLGGFNKNGYNLFRSHPLKLIRVQVFEGPSSNYFTKNTSHDHTIKLPCRSFGKGLYFIKTVSNCWPAGTSTISAF